ncbi:MAG: DUF1801 domain-containing protein [Anaerolineales bacterium]
MKPSEQITKRISELPAWQGKLMARMRNLVHKVDPDITEEWKWDTPVFSHNGLVCAIGSFSDHVGMNVFKGASLKDPRRIFNGGLEAKTSRSVNFKEGDSIDEAALLEVIRAAVALNAGGGKKAAAGSNAKTVRGAKKAKRK